MHRVTARRAVALAGAPIVVLTVACCSGPQPLSRAVDPDDAAIYLGMFESAEQTPRDAFLAWRSEMLGITVEEAAARDAALGSRRNPFNARRDLSAVSRGAVIYSNECMDCHGPNADGTGPMMPGPLDSMDFHRFGMRFAVGLHNGAPKSWFRTLRDGASAEVELEDGTSAVVEMPGYSDRLAVEQIWLLVTYLQSRDMDLPSKG